MKVILIIAGVVVLGVIALIAVFNSRSKVYAFQTEYNGIPLQLEVYNQQQYAHSYYFMLLTYGKLKPLKITVRDITGSWLPWKKELYQSAPFYQWDTVRHAVPHSYNSNFSDDACWPYFIYANPKGYTKEEFDVLGQCLQAKAKELEAALYKDFIRPAHHFNYPQLVGIVYGRRGDFVLQYQTDNLVCYIQPDKRVEIKKANDPDNIEITGFVTAENQLSFRENDLRRIVPVTVESFVSNATGRRLSEDFRIEITETND